MNNERTPDEQRAYEAGQRFGKEIADALEQSVRTFYRKAFPNTPFPLDTVVDADDVPAKPKLLKGEAR